MLYTFFIDGFKITSTAIEFNMNAASVLHSGWKPNMISNKKHLNAKLDTETWQFISLDHFNKNEIDEISNWTQVRHSEIT